MSLHSTLRGDRILTIALEKRDGLHIVRMTDGVSLWNKAFDHEPTRTDLASILTQPGKAVETTIEPIAPDSVIGQIRRRFQSGELTDLQPWTAPSKGGDQ